jgi:hypothetical protein
MSQRCIRRQVPGIRILASDHGLADLDFLARDDVGTSVRLITLLDEGIDLFVQAFDVSVHGGKVFEDFSAHNIGFALESV